LPAHSATWGGDAGVEPGGQAGVAQVVGAFGQWGGSLGWRQGGLAGVLPGGGAYGVGEQITGFTAEQAAVGGGVVFGEVVAQQSGERWGDRDWADFFDGAVFEVSAFAAGAGFVPGAANAHGLATQTEPPQVSSLPLARFPWHGTLSRRLFGLSKLSRRRTRTRTTCSVARRPTLTAGPHAATRPSTGVRRGRARHGQNPGLL
jgi:hypothetical protein